MRKARELNRLEKILKAHDAFFTISQRSNHDSIGGYKCDNDIYLYNTKKDILKLIYTIDKDFIKDFDFLPNYCFFDAKLCEAENKESETNFLNFSLEVIEQPIQQYSKLYSDIENAKRKKEAQAKEKQAELKAQMQRAKELESKKEAQRANIESKIQNKQDSKTETKGNKQCKRHSGNTTPARPFKTKILSKRNSNTQRAKLRTKAGKRKRSFMYFYKHKLKDAISNETKILKQAKPKAKASKPDKVFDNLFEFFSLSA